MNDISKDKDEKTYDPTYSKKKRNLNQIEVIPMRIEWQRCRKSLGVAISFGTNYCYFYCHLFSVCTWSERVNWWTKPSNGLKTGKALHEMNWPFEVIMNHQNLRGQLGEITLENSLKKGTWQQHLIPRLLGCLHVIISTLHTLILSSECKSECFNEEEKFGQKRWCGLNLLLLWAEVLKLLTLACVAETRSTERESALDTQGIDCRAPRVNEQCVSWLKEIHFSKLLKKVCPTLARLL